MGLMDIGQNNPYARINPFAAFIDQGLKGYQSEEQRQSDRRKEAIAKEQQAQLMAMKQAEAQRLADQDAANKLASSALRDRIAATQDRPIQTGLLSEGDFKGMSMLPQRQAMPQVIDPASMKQPVFAGQPMTQQDMLNFRAQYAGTPTAEAVGQNAVLMAKENPNEFYQKLLASGKYTPESVVDFAAGNGKLQFAKDPTQVTWSEPFVANVGGKKALVQRSSTGQIKPVIEDKSTTIVNKGDGGRKYEFKDVMGLRKEFSADPIVKDYVTIDAQTRRARVALAESLKSGSNNTPIDQTVITTFNKILDPTSVVRESEYARTPQDMAVLNRLKGKWSKISQGGAGLDAGTRAAMLRMVENFHNVSSEQYNATVENYSEIARRNGFDPKDVIKFGHSTSRYTAPSSSGGQAVAPVGKVGKYSYTVSK